MPEDRGSMNCLKGISGSLRPGNSSERSPLSRLTGTERMTGHDAY